MQRNNLSEENLLASRDGARSILADIFPKRRSRFAIFASFATVSLLGFLFFTFWTEQPRSQAIIGEDIPQPGNTTHSTLSGILDPFGPEANLIGAPTPQFRDNLRPDRKYLTSWISAGWTNDVMTYMNLVYLALITDRIPIIPMFTPSHIGSSVPPIDFGLVFDVPRFRKALGKPVLEWHEVKDRTSGLFDEIGCWNTWEAVQDREHNPRNSHVPAHLKLDISYTKAPSWIKLIPNFENDMHTTFWALAALAFPETRAASLVTPLESPEHHVSLPPDEHVICYDYLYFVGANQPFEFEFDYSPAWRYVGQHMHFTPVIEGLAEEYVKRAIGAVEGEATPPWIAIHVRRGDFKVFCGDVVEGCYAPLPVIARRVEEVKAELLERKGIVVSHVIMTSDERNATWWEEVTGLGWFGVDHSQTTELLGPWYPVLIDAAIQGGGVGFVGTDRSTMSLIARRRVQSWKDGAVRTVKWGKPDSDDH